MNSKIGEGEMDVSDIIEFGQRVVYHPKITEEEDEAQLELAGLFTIPQIEAILKRVRTHESDRKD